MNIFKKLAKFFISRNALNIILMIILSLSSIQSSFAATVIVHDTTSASILRDIKNNTDKILTKINDLPDFISKYFKDLLAMATSWTKTKGNDVIGKNQDKFNSLTNDYDKNNIEQIRLTKNFSEAFLTNDKKYNLPDKANELNYLILMGQLIDSTKAKPDHKTFETLSEAYLKHLTGVKLAMEPPQPLPKWTNKDKKEQYLALYYTTTAISSYNSYLLSSLINQPNRDATRIKLIDQASNKAWFEQVATEDLGFVLRQILMYTSQIYVSLDRQLKVQQEQLAAQAMTNTLLNIFGSYQVSAMLISEGHRG